MYNNNSNEGDIMKNIILNTEKTLIKLTKNYGGTGCIAEGEPRETTIEICYKNDSDKRVWYINKKHQYIITEPSGRSVLKTMETSKEIDESYVQTICGKLENMNLQTYNGSNILTGIPQTFLAKWYFNYGADIKMSYSNGYEPECIKELQELLGFELTEMHFMNNVYTEIENLSAKEYYGQRFGLLDIKRKERI